MSPDDEMEAETPEGITLRQWYAGLALQGLLADDKDREDERMGDESCCEAVARLAVQHADELIRRLEK